MRVARHRAWLLLLLSAPAWAAPVREDALERRTLDIAKELRCAVCQNQPVSESNAALARDMRAIIREQLAAGKSREEIVDYFVERYGEFVLMKPPYAGPGFAVWAGPVILLAVLGASGFIYLRRRRRAPAAPPPALSAEDRARVEAARRQDEA
jgi:cytochrome c-type biogenesis protein CcmH